MIKIRGLAHSALRITDADRSIAFYDKVLGLKPLSSRPNFGFGGAWLGVGNNQIHLISAEKREGVINRLGIGRCGIGGEYRDRIGNAQRLRAPAPT